MKTKNEFDHFEHEKKSVQVEYFQPVVQINQESARVNTASISQKKGKRKIDFQTFLNPSKSMLENKQTNQKSVHEKSFEIGIPKFDSLNKWIGPRQSVETFR